MFPQKNRGFSLIELVVVITVIGILALLAVPGITMAAQRAKATAAANDIRVFTNAVELHNTAEGTYPRNMSVHRLPQAIKDYLPNVWTDGTYNWFYENNEGLIYIYIFNLNFTPEQILELDIMIDDGNISTGRTTIAPRGTGLVHLFQGN